MGFLRLMKKGISAGQEGHPESFLFVMLVCGHGGNRVPLQWSGLRVK